VSELKYLGICCKPKGIRCVKHLMTPYFRTFIPRYLTAGRTAKFAGILWIWHAVIGGRKGVTEFHQGNALENAINSRCG
jgi:hypothetical protein